MTTGAYWAGGDAGISAASEVEHGRSLFPPPQDPLPYRDGTAESADPWASITSSLKDVILEDSEENANPERTHDYQTVEFGRSASLPVPAVASGSRPPRSPTRAMPQGYAQPVDGQDVDWLRSAAASALGASLPDMGGTHGAPGFPPASPMGPVASRTPGRFPRSHSLGMHEGMAYPASGLEPRLSVETSPTGRAYGQFDPRMNEGHMRYREAVSDGLLPRDSPHSLSGYATEMFDSASPAAFLPPYSPLEAPRQARPDFEPFPGQSAIASPPMSFETIDQSVDGFRTPRASPPVTHLAVPEHDSGFDKRCSPPHSRPSPSPIGRPPQTPDLSKFDLGSSVTPASSVSPPSPPRESQHTSRSIVVRNVAPGVDDDDLRKQLEAFGPLRELGAQQRSRGGRGSITATYFDLRHARQAVRHLDGLMLRGRPVDVRFCTAAEEAALLAAHTDRSGGVSEYNQGTLVVFNVDVSTRAEDIRRVFGAHGSVKEIRETPHKRHHKFIEFYDVRDAERAMRVLNKTELNGKKIKIEISRPGGSRGVNTSPPLRSAPSPSGSPNLHASAFPPLEHLSSNPTAVHGYNRSPMRQNGGSDSHEGLTALNLGPAATPMTQCGNPKFVLNIERVKSGEDSRTALMVRNIPNKYNQRMLLSAIEENHHGEFDFFYLPIDFKNKCNVGYCFINFVDPSYIADFYEDFHGKKWGKFNSEKVCEITYARIQGKASLIAHFQNSSLMNEDPKCRPVIFGEDGQQEEFPVGPHVRTRRGPSAREGKTGDPN